MGGPEKGEPRPSGMPDAVVHPDRRPAEADTLFKEAGEPAAAVLQAYAVLHPPRAQSPVPDLPVVRQADPPPVHRFNGRRGGVGEHVVDPGALRAFKAQPAGDRAEDVSGALVEQLPVRALIKEGSDVPAPSGEHQQAQRLVFQPQAGGLLIAGGDDLHRHR